MSFSVNHSLGGPEAPWEHTFGVEPLEGWRVWRVNTYKRLDGTSDLRLGPIAGDLLWHPHERATAHCVRNASVYTPHEAHEAPQPDCACGLWAVRDREAAEAVIAERIAASHVYGRVAMWGRVLEFEQGFRAQYAYPLELIGAHTYRETLRGLSKVYAVPYKLVVAPAPKPAPDSMQRRAPPAIYVYANLLSHLRHMDWVKDDIKLSLHRVGYRLSQGSDRFFSDVTHEISPTNGYPPGGFLLENRTRTIDAAALEERFHAANLTIAAGGEPFRYGVIRKDSGAPSTSPLIAYVDFGHDVQPPFTIEWAPAGVFFAGVT